MDPPMHYNHPSASQYSAAHPQLSTSSNIFQYTSGNPPTTSTPDQTLIQSLPSEYDLVTQSPEERAVLLEVLRERRRVRELELKILEERRREREAGEQAVGSNPGSTSSPTSAASTRAMSDWATIPDLDRVAFSALGVTRHPPPTVASQSSASAGPPQTPSSERYTSAATAAGAPHPQTQQHHSHHLYTHPGGSNPADDAPNFLNYEQPPAPARPLTGVSTTSSSSSSFANVFDSLPPGLGLSASPSVPTHAQSRSPHHHDNLQSHDAGGRLGPQDAFASSAAGHYASHQEPRDSALQGSAARPASQHGTPYENGLYGHGTTLPPMTGGWGSPSDHHPPPGNPVSIGGSPNGHGIPSSSSALYNPIPSQPTVPSMQPIVRSSPSNFTGDVNAHMYDEPRRLSQNAHGYPIAGSRNPSLEDGTPSPHHFYSTPSPNHLIHQQAPSPYDDHFHPSMQVKHPRLDSTSSASGLAYVPSTIHHGLNHTPTPPSNMSHIHPTPPAFSILPTPPSVAGPSSAAASAAAAAAAGKKPKKLLFERQIARDAHRRYLGLSWAKSRARRERAAGKLPDPSKYAEGSQDVLMENVRRTNLLVPPASTLVGMWIVDWDMQNRSILLSTSAPFESSDAEDKNIIGVGELMTRVLQDYEQYKMTNPTSTIRPPQHLWIATRSITALGNARMNDTLTRRRGFVPVDEYIALHPGTDRTLFTSVPDGHAWIDEAPWIRNPESGDLEVLVRWLGDEIDMARLDQIKDMEYGRKSKEVQIASRARKPSGSK
ncbi:hypothetical protein FRB90_012807 [Tulasnella sp. 427]|nr:hypothetical protein FRB90_012807 [Tulasnella sp. 427]